MATVKGDVHDIGKNIVGVVLACNNYEIIDLGVMVPATKILETAKAEKVDIIGLSGLITPSLDEMVHVAAEMEREGFDDPAADRRGDDQPRPHGGQDPPALRARARPSTSPTPAAPSASSRACSRPRPRPAMSPTVRAEYRKVADAHARAELDKQRLPLAAARANAHRIDWAAYAPPRPSFLGTRVFETWDLAELARYIDWTPFFQTWELKGRYPEILDDEAQGAAARQLFDDAQAMLAKIIAEQWFRPARRRRLLAGQRGRRRHPPLHRRGPRPTSSRRFFTLRQQRAKRRGRRTSRWPTSSRRWARPTTSAASSSPPASRKSRSPSASSGPTTTIPRSWSRRWPTASPRPSPSDCTSASAASSGAMRRTRPSRPRS